LARARSNALSHAAAAARADSLELNTSNSVIMRWSNDAAERPECI